MVIPQENMWSQGIGRLEIQKELRVDPGTETTEVWGEIEILSPALVHARNFRLKSIENLQLTVDVHDTTTEGHDIFASKTVYNKGRKGNYASIYLFDNSSDAQTTGSHYVNFLAMGE